jgi:tRNA-dihydrouridine synthase A
MARAFFCNPPGMTRSFAVHRRRRIGQQQQQQLLRFASDTLTGDADQVRQAKYNELLDATTLSLAPMMEYTDRHFRHLVRLVSNRTLLYTEMVAANALANERKNVMEEYRQTINNGSERSGFALSTTTASATTNEILRDNYDDHYLQRYLAQGRVMPEGPSVLQLGGSDPEQMFQAAQTVLDMTARGHCDYTAINLNCGCPSPKVAGKGCFGAALMDEPRLVAELTKALHEGTEGRLPVTVKCRIGTDSDQAFTRQAYAAIDPEQEYSKLRSFIETVASDGIVTDFSVHARIAVLQKSFSPSDNRKIPPLKYDIVRRLVQEYPDLTFSLNGGVESISQAQAEFATSPGLKGVMIGRSWAADPWSFAMADRLLYKDENAPRNRLEILQAFGRHADREEELGDPVKIRRFIVKAVTPLFTGEINAKRYRIALNEIAGLPKKLAQQGKSLDGQAPLSELILNAAVEYFSEETLLRSPEESYARILDEEEKRKSGTAGDGVRSNSVAEWQTRRKEEEQEQQASLNG